MLYDIVVIGAGPGGLAAAARICEKTPSALFTNEEHARYWKKHKRHENSLEQEHRRRKSSGKSGYGGEKGVAHTRPSIAVLDAASDQWLFAWKQRFRALKISHLRSPLFFHLDPRDRDGLLAYAHEHDRVNELREIPNVIDYFTPSSQLFEDLCDEVIERYKLRDVVQQTSVLDITFDSQPQNLDHGLFTLRTNDAVIHSRIVIMATGPSVPAAPPNFCQLSPPAQEKGSVKHVFQSGGTDLPVHIENKLRSASWRIINIVIVGGGLTSAQLVDLFLAKHSSRPNLHIHLLLRHPKLKQKHFDIDLPWVTKTRNHLMSTYWSADSDEDRIDMLRKARNGGSVNPPFAKILQKHVAAGKVSVHVDTKLQLDEECVWNDSAQLWTRLSLTSTAPAPSTFKMPDAGIDHIVFCTGATPCIQEVPFLQSLQREKPIKSLNGLPILTDDLMYDEDTPLFFTGALAALRLGPGAANLAGARQGAERIAWAVDEILGLDEKRQLCGDPKCSQDEATHMERSDGQREWSEFTGSFSNQFATLVMD